MITVTLPDELELAVSAAAKRQGLSVNEYVAAVCGEALSLEVDRERLRSYRDGDIAGVPRDRADAWLSDLAAGKWSECPR